MKKDTGLTGHFFRLVRTERNMFTVETIVLKEGKIVEVLKDEPTFLTIAFDKLRRKTGESFFAAVTEEHNA